MKEIDDNLLTEFLEGKLDEPANREIENWYDASEENRRRLEALYFVLIVHAVQTMLVVALGIYGWLALQFTRKKA